MASKHATNTRDIGHLFDYTKSGNKNGQAPALTGVVPGLTTAKEWL